MQAALVQGDSDAKQLSFKAILKGRIVVFATVALTKCARWLDRSGRPRRRRRIGIRAVQQAIRQIPATGPQIQP